MKKTLIPTLFLLLSCFVPLLFGGTSYAGNWVDDWFQQATYSGPQSFEGQKRGYWTGGNMSIRYNPSTDFPFTVSLPKLKAGCGGIDVFMGGFSFLNMDKLGDKFQSIMTGAATYAFDLALETVCPQCSKIYKDLENIANKLNSIQLNDCKASKAIVVAAKSEIVGLWKGEGSGQAVTELSKYSQEAGLSTLYSDAKKNTETNPQQAANDLKNSVTGGNANIETLVYGQGSLLGKIGIKYNLDTRWINLARGYIGDILVKEENNPMSTEEIIACPRNTPEAFMDFVNNNVYLQTCSSANCTCSQDTSLLTSYISDNLDRVNAAAVNKTPLSQETQAFIQRAPAPVYINIMNFLSINDAQSVEDLKQNLTVMYSIKQLQDLYVNIGKAVDKYEAAVKAQDVEGNVFTVQHLEFMEKMLARIKEQNKFLSNKLDSEKQLYIQVVELRIKQMENTFEPGKLKILGNVINK